MSKIIKIGDTITKDVLVINPNTTTYTDELIVDVMIPVGFDLVSSSADIGVFDGSTWTITNLPPRTNPTLQLEIEAVESCPENNISVAIIDKPDDPDQSNNSVTHSLEFITCCEVNDCLVSSGVIQAGNNISVENDPQNGTVTISGQRTEINETPTDFSITEFDTDGNDTTTVIPKIIFTDNGDGTVTVTDSSGNTITLSTP